LHYSGGIPSSDLNSWHAAVCTAQAATFFKA
jgi:hypothetical protein